MEKEINKPDGNDFQYKIKRTLTNAGWTVRMSPYYNDSFSEKPREIDIIAEKPFNPNPNSVHVGIIIVRLFIECKYVTGQTIFWFEERNLHEAKGVVDSTHSFYEVEKNHDVKRNHHYLSNDLIAKLYRTEGKDKDSEGDPIYKAMTQCLNATIYYRNRPTDLKTVYREHNQPIEELNYSIIMLNSFEKFLKKDTTRDSTTEPITQPFQLEIDYAYTVKNTDQKEFFYIDILNTDNFTHFEENMLSKEIDLARRKIADDASEAMFNSNRNNESSYNSF